MKAAGFGVYWSSAFRANTVHDKCAFRSLPYTTIFLHNGKLPYSHHPWKPKRSGSPPIPHKSPTKSPALGLQLDTRILSKHIA
jgi:hypothetical protein